MSEHPQNPDVRTGQSESRLSHAEFAARFRARFADPAFAGKSAGIEELLEVAWDGYRNARKSAAMAIRRAPRRCAGGFRTGLTI